MYDRRKMFMYKVAQCYWIDRVFEKRGDVIMVRIDSEWLSKAYKKLKSSVYFDKTNLILRDKIVDFESSIEDLEDYFKKLASKINDKKEFKKLEKDILDSISILYFPKKLGDGKKIRDNDSESVLIVNDCSKNLQIDEMQYFIDMDVRGHILGVLWIMLIGYRVDKKYDDFTEVLDVIESTQVVRFRIEDRTIIVY